MTDGIDLSALVRDGLASGVRGDETVRVRGIRHDSRRVEPGDLFVAIDGVHHDGTDYIGDAIGRGAVAVLSEKPLELEVPSLTADSALVALSEISMRLYGDPTASIPVVGVTGTNGKTTTTFMLEAMLTAAGHRPAVIGTVNFRGPQGTRPATHTTPMADDLMRITRDAVDGGATHLVLEVSSHALAMHRADGVHFGVAALTNLTQDHLDYHGDFASYERAKRRLFEELNPGVSVLNIDDDLGARLSNALSGRLLRCSRRADAEAEIRAGSWSSDRNGITAVVETPSGNLSIQSPLIGDHNLENLLLALGCGLALGIGPDRLAEGLRDFGGAPGRLERIADPRQVLVAVDYAHTPDALDRVLAALRPITDRRLLVAFGCGGDRDREKRPLMGEAAARRADLLLLTSDNPRGEPPELILDQIEEGVRGTGLQSIGEADLRSLQKGYIVESDRRRAIDMAVAAAGPGDTVLIAGKGHETVQIIGDQRNPFDDRVEARRAIAAVAAS